MTLTELSTVNDQEFTHYLRNARTTTYEDVKRNDQAHDVNDYTPAERNSYQEV